ncbi:MAG: L-threonylcarbamoyladenylate synthase, partial [Burkholderiales bacterium]
IRQIDEDHHLTLVCRDISQIGQYAHINDRQYRLLRMTTPGSYTFILRGSREVPKRSLNPKRRTIGVRVPDHAVVSALLAKLGEPILSSTLILPDLKRPLTDPEEIRARLKHDVDLILDAGSCGEIMTTIVDLTGEALKIVREGKGSLPPFMEASAA